ncbi:hypothetical protein Fmac_010173 [Flemingia macrophylla]|uniref:TIR domain-containing protein n=1 Tax=Flemingia macrophylla TaxID=520843 RepID=A0ABD1N2I3_9FABA
MDEQQRTSSVVSSSKKYEYDVFLSFRGEDTRKNFTSHLDKALNKEKIKTFIDDQLEKGDEISPALIKAIENSCISIVIFSKNYAFSKWCLNELNKIMECKRAQDQIVMPVFYDIDPSHVRKQIEGYEGAFEKHKEDSRCDQWRNDLTEAANIAGWDSQNSKTEAELLDVIVETVLKKLVPKHSSRRDGLVGIENSYEEIKSLLKIGSDEVKIFGIWGMGGIGKTTLANSFYEKISPNFEGRCFLENVREKSEKGQNLCEEIFSKLCGEKIRCFDASVLRWLLQRKRVFIVLDDVVAQEQLEEVIYQFYPLGPGSRVIVTTRNKQIFRLDDVTYSVLKLSPHHSLELLCLNAFEEKQPKDGYEDISKEVISYCGGIPLALKVVGASLRSKSKEVWECQLNKLRSIPDIKIQKALKLSYDDLDDSQQSIFLDIACFFKGKPRNDMFQVSEIEVLLDKSLITIHHTHNKEVIEMHDLIQEMGHEIVRQESIKYPERRSRLWKHEEVIDVLKRNKKNEVVEGIILNLELLDESLNLSYDFLANMTCLRILKIHGYRDEKESFNIYFPNGLESFSNKLRYLHWNQCCLESLPSKFCVEQLVVLRMRNNKFKKLWDGVQNLVNLKEIDLQHSMYLTDIPDLSKAKTLERVNLSCCGNLQQLHPSISSVPKLKYMDLSSCIRIGSLTIHSKYLSQLYLWECTSLTNISVTSDKLTALDLYELIRLESLNVNSRSLGYLSFHLCCSSLKEISVVSEEITQLNLSFSAITSFSSNSSLPKLRYLKLSDCKEIEILHLHSKSLEILDLNGCSSLKEISMTLEEVTRLDFRGTAITSLPLSISSLPKLRCLYLSDCKEIEILHLHSKSLEILDLNGCSSLKEISMTLEEVTKLVLSGTAITSLPSSISSLLNLTTLVLRECRNLVSLPELPSALRKLDASYCISLKTEISQRVVLQHILQNIIPNLRNDYFVCRVGHVIDECVFQTASIPALNMSHLSGFIYCFILKEKNFYGEMLVSIYQDGELLWDSQYTLGSFHFSTAQLGFWYHDISKFDSENEAYDHSRDVQIKFQLKDIIARKEKVTKGFGVFPVYATTSGFKLQIYESQSIEAEEQPFRSKRKRKRT